MDTGHLEYFMLNSTLNELEEAYEEEKKMLLGHKNNLVQEITGKQLEINFDNKINKSIDSSI